MNAMRARAVLAACLSILVPAFAMAQETAVKPRWNEAQRAVADTVERYAAAYGNHDVKALEGYFAEDARLVTVDGEVYEGRAAILELFREGFEGNPGLSMTSDVRSIRMIGASVAIETGFLSTRTEADPRDNVVAYEVVHVKRDGSWRMFDIFETSPAEEGPKELHSEKLAPLDFLAGEWIEESETATIVHTVRWTPNHRYLLLNYHSESPDGKPLRIAEQRIGWDPRNKSIRSWIFEEDGGHAESIWTQGADGSSWTIRVDGVLADGRAIVSTSKLEMVSKDRIRISGYDRSIDGVEQPDAPRRHLVRKPPGSPAPAVR